MGGKNRQPSTPSGRGQLECPRTVLIGKGTLLSKTKELRKDKRKSPRIEEEGINLPKTKDNVF